MSQKNIDDFYSSNVKLDEKGNTHYLSDSAIKKEESYIIYAVIKKYKPVKTLEVGLASAGSALAIIEGKLESRIAEKHIALDPFQSKGANNVGLQSLKNLGLRDKIVCFEEFSEQYFNKMHVQKEFFDFIFIDGDHTIGQAVTDVFLADKILNKNGIIGIHDSLLFSTAASIKYLLLEKKYSIVSPDYNSFKKYIRQLWYIRRLGLWYCMNVIPKINVSTIFLQKNAS